MITLENRLGFILREMQEVGHHAGEALREGV